jgi:hypothetical protein
VKVATAPAALVASGDWSSGSIRTGAALYASVAVKLPVAVLPAASAAVHVTVVEPIGRVAPDAGAQVTATTLSTTSVAEAACVATAPALLVASSV